MAAIRSPPALEAAESSTPRNKNNDDDDDDGDGPSGLSPHMLEDKKNVLHNSSGPKVVDFLANLPDPLNTPDVSHGGIAQQPGPGPPTQTPPDLEGHAHFMTLPHHGKEVSVQQKNDDKTKPLQKQLGEAVSSDLQQSDSLHGEALETGVLESSVVSATNGEDSGSSNHGAQPASQGASDPTNLSEEEQDGDSASTASALEDQVTSSWKQKEKQKAEPEAESEALPGEENEATSQLPSQNDPDWEKSAERPPQKLPVRFKDAVGRNFIFPWEKAKTWTGMMRLIQSAFIHVDIIGPHVLAGHYDLSITMNLPVLTDHSTVVPPPAAALHPTPVSALVSDSATGITSASSAAGSSSTTAPAQSSSSGTSPPQEQQPLKPHQVVVLPELWEDIIEPGMLVVQQMWPMASPPINPPPPPPSSSLHHHHYHHHSPHPPHPPHHAAVASRGRGHVRGRGRGGGVIMMGRGGNVYGPPPPPPPGHPVLSWMGSAAVEPPRGKTRKRRDRM